MDDELPSSQLGTKDYWDTVYENEIVNFGDTGDVGEVWFGYDSVERILNWIEKSELVSKNSSVIDLGCGNGVVLTEMYKLGYTELTGVDYSQRAIDLATAVAKEEAACIRYETCDIVADISAAGKGCLHEQFDVCIDKGTYDAISLNPENSKANREKYLINIRKLMKEGGLFILTSCNWTEDELRSFFKEGFTVMKKIPTPSFQFGGKSGNSTTVLVFRKEGS